MQARRDPLDLCARQRLAQRCNKRIAARPVADAHPAQVTIELATLDEVGQGTLLDPAGAAVGEMLLERQFVDEPGRRDEPSQP